MKSEEMTARPYYSDASAAFFDVLTAADRALDGDVEVYASLARPGASVLEIGSGTGRVTHALAERGLRVTGVEPAPAMIRLAEAKRATLPPAVAARARHVETDVLSLDLGRRFDLVIAPYYVVAHLPADNWTSALKRMASHIGPKGRIAVHMPSPEVLATAAPPAGDLVFQAREQSLRVFMGGQQRSDAAVALDLVYESKSPLGATVRSRERLTLFLGDIDQAAASAGLSPDRAPIPLGDAGAVHVFRR